MRLILAPLAFAWPSLAACASAPATQPAVRAGSAAARHRCPAVAHPDGETAAWWYRAGAARAAGNGAMAGQRAERDPVPRRRHEPDHGRRRAHPRGPARGPARRGNAAGVRALPAHRAQPHLQHRFPDARFGRHDDRDRDRREDAAGRDRHRPGQRARRLRRQSPATTLLSSSNWPTAAGLATGVVTTTRLTHATPASIFAHGPDRNWEDDSYLPAGEDGRGLSRPRRAVRSTSPFGDGPDVALGGGRAKFTPDTMADPEYASTKRHAPDGRDLVAEWQAQASERTLRLECDATRAAPAMRRACSACSSRTHMQYDRATASRTRRRADARRDDARGDRAPAAQCQGLRAAGRRRPHRPRAPRRQRLPRAGGNHRVVRCGARRGRR